MSRFRADPLFTALIPNAATDLKPLAEELFKPYGVQVRATDSQLMLQPLVRTRVILAELARDKSRELGVQWPNEYNAQVLPNIDTPDALMVDVEGS